MFCADTTVGTRQPKRKAVRAATKCSSRATGCRAPDLTRFSHYAGIIQPCPPCRLPARSVFLDPAHSMPDFEKQKAGLMTINDLRHQPRLSPQILPRPLSVSAGSLAVAAAGTN